MPRRLSPLREHQRVELNARVEALEQRLRQLEARVRNDAPRPSDTAGGKSTKTSKGKHPKHRCPGCTLELPKGRRGDSCVWCGFRFDGVRLLRASSGR